MDDLTPEQIAQHYSAAMDSVDLLNAAVAVAMAVIGSNIHHSPHSHGPIRLLLTSHHSPR